MAIRVRLTRWEGRRLADILRTRTIVPQQYDWADNLADMIDNELAKNEERNKRKGTDNVRLGR